MSLQSRTDSRYLKAARNNDRVSLDAALAVNDTDFWSGNVVRGPKIMARDGSGRTALMLAAYYGHQQMAAYLAKLNFRNQSIDALATDNMGNSALHYACMSGQADLVQDMLRLKLPVNQPNNEGKTPLLTAIEKGHGHLIELLAKAGADVNKPDNKGVFPLYFAAERMQKHIMEHLLTLGANVNQVNNQGKTPLHRVLETSTEYASSRAFRLEAAKLLVEKGTDLAISSNAGKKLSDDQLIISILTPPEENNGKGALARLFGKGETPAAATPPKPEPAETPAPASMAGNPKLREAFINEGLDPDADEQWRPMGQSVIEHVIGSIDNPRVLTTTFNFAARQCSSTARNLLTGQVTAQTTEAMDSFPNPDYVAEAHQRLCDAGKTPPPLWPVGAPLAAKKGGLAGKL